MVHNVQTVLTLPIMMDKRVCTIKKLSPKVYTCTYQCVLSLRGSHREHAGHGSIRIQASRSRALTQQQQMEGGAAMSMRLTPGCGSLGAASPPGVVWRWRILQTRTERKKAARDESIKRVWETRRHRKADKAWFEVKSGCDLCVPVCVCESMDQYVLACTSVYLVHLALSKYRIFFALDTRICCTVHGKCIPPHSNLKAMSDGDQQ